MSSPGFPHFARLPRRLVIGGAALLPLRPAPAAAQPDRLAATIRDFTGGAPVTPGRVAIDISELVENGNAVPVTVSAEAASPAALVRRLAMFNERNPQPEMFVATFLPRPGRQAVATRIRLATSQKLVALAELSDGTWWSDDVDVVVTLAACVEG
jgi:sulfur-oxidizing protein SoxY